MRFGVTLSNRGILLGPVTVPKLRALADAVEACPLLDGVWAVDALLADAPSAASAIFLPR